MKTRQGRFNARLLRGALADARIPTDCPVRIDCPSPGVLVIKADWLRTEETPEQRLERLSVRARLLSASLQADKAIDRLIEQRPALAVEA